LAEVLRINENDPQNKQSVYFQKTSDGKQLLRDMMKRYIPTEMTNAEKQGFSSPDASWFKGESIDFVRRTLIQGEPRIYNLLDRKTVTEMINEHFQGSQNRRLLIWSLLNVEAWIGSNL
jgi:asparagine synthase (glutamine-hydrolysing)